MQGSYSPSWGGALRDEPKTAALETNFTSEARNSHHLINKLDADGALILPPPASLHQYCVLRVFKANKATRIAEKSKEGFDDTSGDRAEGLSHRRPRTNHLCRSLLLGSRNLPFSVLY